MTIDWLTFQLNSSQRYCLPDFTGPLTLSRFEKARPVRTCDLGGRAHGPWLTAERDCSGMGREHASNVSVAHWWVSCNWVSMSMSMLRCCAVLYKSPSKKGSMYCMTRRLQKCGLLGPGSPSLLDRTLPLESRRGVGLGVHLNSKPNSEISGSVTLRSYVTYLL